MLKLGRLLALAVLLVSVSSCKVDNEGIKQRDEESSLSFPQEQQQVVVHQRHDLFFGYYGTNGNTVIETKDHVNVIMEMWFEGLEAGLMKIMQSDPFADLIIGLHWETYDYQTHQIRTDGENQIRRVFDALRSINVLDRVIAVYPVDEPNLQGLSAEVIREGNALVRKVMKEYPDLEEAKIMGFYGRNDATANECGCSPVAGMPGIDSYDWVGVTDYGHNPPAKILADLKVFLNKKQKIVFVVDGTNVNKERPKPYLDAANNDRQVIGIIGFTWFDHGDPARGVTQGIKSSGLAPYYLELGKAITGLKETPK